MIRTLGPLNILQLKIIHDVDEFVRGERGVAAKFPENKNPQAVAGKVRDLKQYAKGILIRRVAEGVGEGTTGLL